MLNHPPNPRPKPKPTPLHLLSLSLSLSVSLSLISSSHSSDSLSLLAFQSKADPYRALPYPPNPSPSPCHWLGVKCNRGGRVVRLVLTNLPLRGTLPPNTLTGLDQLRLLNLRNNSLTGALPDLSPLSHLRALFLDHNSFSGRFPISVLSFPRLRSLDLSHNAFSGPIPDALADLPDIHYVRLDSNRFNGSVPALNQSSLIVFNVSRNELSGAVPVTRALSRFDGSAFGFNPGLCGRIVGTECGDERASPFFRPWVAAAPAPATSNALDQQLHRNAPPPPPPPLIRRKRESRTGLISVFSVLSLVLIGCVVSLLLLGVNRRKQERLKRVPMLHKRAVSVSDFGSEIRVEEEKINNNNNNNNNNRNMNNSNDKTKEAVKSGNLVFCAGDDQIYTLEQLMRGSAELLGRGTIGSTYKAVLESNVCATVKRFDGNKTHVTSREMFERHIVSVSRLRHPNLVPLRAYLQARDREERLLIYDYQANGSVFSLVHGSRSTRAKPMHWTSCLKIAEDVAHGLAYIHQTVRLVHGNLKASNVLLGSDFEALLTDYCLTVFARPPSPEHNMDSYAGYKALRFKSLVTKSLPSLMFMLLVFSCWSYSLVKHHHNNPF
ncbi:hypothetical protein Scep_000993 [Stephania cephalantha]|uniref:Protein kinase domain-containing protein n=1 Tax=Stephania cephalantha TaxID=152367 RepID=A0AAP0Q2X7_9MAGN